MKCFLFRIIIVLSKVVVGLISRSIDLYYVDYVENVDNVALESTKTRGIRGFLVHPLLPSENETRISFQIGAETFTKVIHLFVRLKYRLIR